MISTFIHELTDYLDSILHQTRTDLIPKWGVLYMPLRASSLLKTRLWLGLSNRTMPLWREKRSINGQQRHKCGKIYTSTSGYYNGWVVETSGVLIPSNSGYCWFKSDHFPFASFWLAIHDPSREPALSIVDVGAFLHQPVQHCPWSPDWLHLEHCMLVTISSPMMFL